MKHLKENMIAGIILVLCVVFFISVAVDLDLFGDYIRVLIFPLLLLYYVINVEDKNKFLLAFLILFIIAELGLFLAVNYGLIEKFGIAVMPIGTLSYVLSYSSLLIFIISKINLKSLFRRFPLHSIVLGLFGLYLFYALDNMIKHHGVASISGVEYGLGVIYNITIILVLIFSLLSYLYHDTRKTLLLFVACLCMVFSELVQTAYYFMVREGLLNLVYTSLLSVGFFMLYVYMAYENKSKWSSSLVDEENNFLSAANTKDV